MNQVVLLYNPFLPELKVSINSMAVSDYSALTSFRNSRFSDWCGEIFREIYREVNGPFEMKCVSDAFICGCIEKMAQDFEYCTSFTSEPLPLGSSVNERLAVLEKLGCSAHRDMVIPVYDACRSRTMVPAVFDILSEEGLFSVYGDVPEWEESPLSSVFLREIESDYDITGKTCTVLAFCETLNDRISLNGNYDIYALVMGTETRFIKKNGRCIYFEADPDALSELIMDIIEENELSAYLSEVSADFERENASFLSAAEKGKLALVCEGFPVCTMSLPCEIDAGREYEIEYKVLPEDADVRIRFNIDRPELISAGEKSIKGLRAGRANVMAFFGDDPYPADTKVITVLERNLIQRIGIFPSCIYVELGLAAQAKAVFDPPSAANADEIRWYSSDTQIAEIDETTGEIKGVKVGSCKVSASTCEACAQAECIVQPPVEEIWVSAASVEVKAGQYVALNFAAGPQNAYGADRIEAVSTDPSVAEYRGGYIVGHSKGECSIIIKTQDARIKREVAVRVKKKGLGR